MSNFEASLDEWAAQVRADLVGIARQSIFKLAGNVVQDTPVDTGNLRGHWQPSFGEPMPAKQEVPFDVGGGLALASLSATLANLTLGETFHYSNGCVYAMRLEYGFVGYDSLGRYYNQAGRYFVTNNLAQWDGIVQATAASFGGQ